jgi:hypothetical protein
MSSTSKNSFLLSNGSILSGNQPQSAQSGSSSGQRRHQTKKSNRSQLGFQERRHQRAEEPIEQRLLHLLGIIRFLDNGMRPFSGDQNFLVLFFFLSGLLSGGFHGESESGVD